MRKLGHIQEEVLIMLGTHGGQWDRMSRFNWDGCFGTAKKIESLIPYGFTICTKTARSLSDRAYEITPAGRDQIERIKARRAARRAW